MIDYDRQTLERLVRLEEHVSVRFKALDKALDLAREGVDYRLKGMNEFRAQLEKQTDTFATSAEIDMRFRETVRRVEELEKRSNMASGASKWTDILLTAGISIVVFVLGWVMVGN